MASGSATVYTNGRQTGRCGDPVSCGSSVASCSSDTFAGDESIGSSVTIKAISVIEKFVEAVKLSKQQEEEYTAAVTKAAGEAYSEIQEYKKDPVDPPPEYVLACTLGKTSERYESGNNGPSTISSGVGDYGGVSYGTYQFMSRGGSSSSCGRFVQQCSYANEFSGLTPGSPEFSAKWLEVCQIDSEGFGQEQHDFIQSEYYDVAMSKLRSLGVDEATICFGVRELIWSTAVQFGPTGCYNIFARAGVNSSTESLAIIDSVYKEKSKVQSYFKSSSTGVQNSVLKRYCTERLQNIDACNGEDCDEVPQGIDNATMDDLMEIKTNDKDLSIKDGYEDFII